MTIPIARRTDTAFANGAAVASPATTSGGDGVRM